MIMKPNGFWGVWGENRGHVYVSDGKTPILGSAQNPSPDPRLPITSMSEQHRAGYVFRAGTVVAISADGRHFVPANGGVANVASYGTGDVAAGVKNATLTGVVSNGGTYTFAANKPVGWLLWDTLQNPGCTPNRFKTDLMQDTPTVFMEGVIYLPVVFKTAEVAGTCAKYNFKNGDLLVADGAPVTADSPTAYVGGVRKYVEGTDSFEQVIGRIIKVEGDFEYDKQGLENFKSDGVDVQSEATQGFPRRIWEGFKEGLGEDYTRKVIWIKILNV